MINVIYVCHASDNLGGASLSLYNLIQSVKHAVYPIVLLQSNGPVYDFYTSAGIECHIVPFPNNIRNSNYLKHILFWIPKYLKYQLMIRVSIKKLNRLLGDRNVHVVHSNSSVCTFGVPLSKAIKAKHIWHIREFGDIDFGIKPFMGSKNLFTAISKADATIAITEAVYNHWKLKEIKNSHYIWDAVRSSHDIVFDPNKEKYFLFCAAILSHTKGVETALRAFGQSGLSALGYRLKLIGRVSSECYMNVLCSIMSEYNITDSVDFLGYQADIKPFMQKATAFIMSSLNEGLGRVTVEAMFYGCPVIARNSGGTMEFIIDGYNGFLFNDDRQCADLMKSIADTSPEAIILSAQKYVIENFSEETYGNRILNIYQKLVKS